MNIIFKYEYLEYQWLAIQRVAALPLCLFLNVLMLLWPSFGIGNETVGTSHTPAFCLSKLRSSLEAGKKQLRVWLQYSCGVTEMLHYSSFRVSFIPTFLTLGRANAFILHSLNRKVPLVLLWYPYGDSEMARNGFGDGSKWCSTSNTCLSVSKTEFFGTGSYVSWKMILCP